MLKLKLVLLQRSRYSGKKNEDRGKSKEILRWSSGGAKTVDRRAETGGIGALSCLVPPNAVHLQQWLVYVLVSFGFVSVCLILLFGHR